MELQSRCAVLVGAMMVSAALAALYEGRLKHERRKENPVHSLWHSPHAFQNSAYYTPKGQLYQRRARRSLLMMYLFGVATMFCQSIVP